MPELNELVSMPWTWQGPTEKNSMGDTWWELRIAELPDFLVAATDREELYSEVFPALREFLTSYLERSELPPLPSEERRGLWQMQVAPALKVIRPDTALEQANLPGATGTLVTQ